MSPAPNPVPGNVLIGEKWQPLSLDGVVRWGDGTDKELVELATFLGRIENVTKKVRQIKVYTVCQVRKAKVYMGDYLIELVRSQNGIWSVVRSCNVSH